MMPEYLDSLRKVNDKLVVRTDMIEEVNLEIDGPFWGMAPFAN